MVLYLKQTVFSKYPKIRFHYRNWNLGRSEVAKVLLVETNMETPTHLSRKLELYIPVSSSELTFSYYYMTVTLKIIWFLSFGWLEFFQQDLHRQLFLSKMGIFLTSIVSCSIYYFCATLTKNIAVRLRFLFKIESDRVLTAYQKVSTIVVPFLFQMICETTTL